jgi:hypothetical protein
VETRDGIEVRFMCGGRYKPLTDLKEVACSTDIYVIVSVMAATQARGQAAVREREVRAAAINPAPAPAATVFAPTPSVGIKNRM